MRKIGNFIVADHGIDNDEDGIQMMLFLIKEMLTGYGKPVSERSVRILSEKYWNRQKEELLKGGINEDILKLFGAKNKREAKSISDELIITGSSFSSLIYNAECNGFKYEKCFNEFLPNNINPEELPTLIHRRGDGDIEIVGATPLSKGQLESVLTSRKKVHAHLFEKQGVWHCFYFTFNDVQGTHWECGNHIHYFSHLWGLSKKQVWDGFNKKVFGFNGLHIRYDESK